MKATEKLLLATGNDGYRYMYHFVKDRKFEELFNNFMKELGFSKQDLHYFNNTYEMGAHGEDREVKRDITKDGGSVEHYKNKDFDVDLFFGVKNLILIIRTKNTNMLVKVANKYFKFKKE